MSDLDLHYQLQSTAILLSKLYKGGFRGGGGGAEVKPHDWHHWHVKEVEVQNGEITTTLEDTLIRADKVWLIIIEKRGM